MHEHHQLSGAGHDGEPGHARIALGQLECVACAEALERKLRASAHVRSAYVDYAEGIAHVTYDPGALTEAEVRALIDGSGSCPDEKRPV